MVRGMYGAVGGISGGQKYNWWVFWWSGMGGVGFPTSSGRIPGGLKKVAGDWVSGISCCWGVGGGVPGYLGWAWWAPWLPELVVAPWGKYASKEGDECT